MAADTLVRLRVLIRMLALRVEVVVPKHTGCDRILT